MPLIPTSEFCDEGGDRQAGREKREREREGERE
jgi:hypothetical protein